MNDHQRRGLNEILNRHDDMARALRESSDAFDMLMRDLRAAVVATHDANEAQRTAIDAMLAANRAALALFNEGA